MIPLPQPPCRRYGQIIYISRVTRTQGTVWSCFRSRLEVWANRTITSYSFVSNWVNAFSWNRVICSFFPTTLCTFYHHPSRVRTLSLAFLVLESLWKILPKFWGETLLSLNLKCGKATIHLPFAMLFLLFTFSQMKCSLEFVNLILSRRLR